MNDTFQTAPKTTYTFLKIYVCHLNDNTSMYDIRWLLLGLIIITILRINCTFDFLTFIELTTNIKFDIIVANTINGKRQLAMIPYLLIPNLVVMTMLRSDTPLIGCIKVLLRRIFRYLPT